MGELRILPHVSHGDWRRRNRKIYAPFFRRPIRRTRESFIRFDGDKKGKMFTASPRCLHMRIYVMSEAVSIALDLSSYPTMRSPVRSHFAAVNKKTDRYTRRKILQLDYKIIRSRSKSRNKNTICVFFFFQEKKIVVSGVQWLMAPFLPSSDHLQQYLIP